MKKLLVLTVLALTVSVCNAWVFTSKKAGGGSIKNIDVQKDYACAYIMGSYKPITKPMAELADAMSMTSCSDKLVYALKAKGITVKKLKKSDISPACRYSACRTGAFFDCRNHSALYRGS